MAVRAVSGAVQLERAEPAHVRERNPEMLTTLGTGLADVPSICVRDGKIEGATPRVVRILAHTETALSQAGISHVHLGEAAALRKDIAQ